MRKQTIISGTAIIALLSIGLPAQADETADLKAAMKDQKELLQAKTDLINAKTDLASAKADQVKAGFEALGLPTAEGKVTLAQNAGAMEAQMLSSDAVRSAGRAIGQAIKANSRKIVVVGPSETLDLTKGKVMALQMEILKEASIEARKDGCSVRPWIGSSARTTGMPSPAGTKGMPAPAVLAAAGEVLKILRVDTEISPLTLSESERILTNAVAQYAPGVVVPTEIVALGDEGSGLYSTWQGLEDERDKLLDCSGGITKALATRKAAHGPGKGENAKAEAEAAARAGAMAEQAKAIDAFRLDAITPTKTGLSPLAAADGVDRLAQLKPLVLRVAIEHVGGTLVKRTNIATAFGAYGVKLTGGLVVSYRLTDPQSGAVAQAGVMVCRTALSGLREVQKGEVPAPVCTAL